MDLLGAACFACALFLKLDPALAFIFLKDVPSQRGSGQSSKKDTGSIGARNLAKTAAIYCVIAMQTILTFVFGIVSNARQQASKVEPVVITSSINKKWL